MTEENKTQHAPLLDLQWTRDCQGKQDYDGGIICVSTRYWPDFTALAGIYFNHADGELIPICVKNFDGETESSVKISVEEWVREKHSKIVRAVNSHEALLETAKLAHAFLESLPMGWLGKTRGDIGALNEFYLAYRKAIAQAEEKP